MYDVWGTGKENRYTNIKGWLWLAPFIWYFLTYYGFLFYSQLHALYDHKNDTYVHHRAVQAYEAAQLLRFGRASEDVVIFSGDMNCTQTDFAYRLVKHNGALIDTYIDSPVKVSHHMISKKSNKWNLVFSGYHYTGSQ